MGAEVSQAPGYRREELLIATLAGLLAGCRSVAIGMLSPLPAAAAYLARAREPGLSVLGILRDGGFTDGGVELFDLAAQGRLDAFFLGGGQIDGAGNLNLVGLGGYPQSRVRWPGSFGSAYLYHLVPRVILFREEHSRRVLVPKVDFVSAAGTGPAGVQRRGGPVALVTGRARFAFAGGRFRLESLHPGERLEEVAAATGFAFERPARVPTTPAPDAATLALLRGPVARELAGSYPRIARALFPEAAPGAA